MINETLIRLKNYNDDTIISTFHTEKPSEFLKLYFFCKVNNIPLSANHTFNNEEINGEICEIKVFSVVENIFHTLIFGLIRTKKYE